MSDSLRRSFPTPTRTYGKVQYTGSPIGPLSLRILYFFVAGRTTYNELKLYYCMPLALANDRQLKHFTFVIPTERTAERSVGRIDNWFQDTGCILDKPTACCPRTSTERESSTAVLVKIALSPKRSLRKIASETELPETRVGYTELCNATNLIRTRYILKKNYMAIDKSRRVQPCKSLNHKKPYRTISCLAMRRVSTAIDK